MVHEKAWAIARTIDPPTFDWQDDKAKLVAIIDQITDDITGGRLEVLKADPFLLQVAQSYAASVLLEMDDTLGWDCPYQSENTEDALLRFLAERWVFARVTGRLR